jgi:hypothetical protein
MNAKRKMDRGSKSKPHIEKGPRASCPHLFFLTSAADCRKRSAFSGSRHTHPMELALHFDDEVFVHDWGVLSEGPFMQLLVVESF